MEYIIQLDISKMTKSIYTQSHKKIIERIRKARLESGLDQNKAAQLLNKSQSFISKIESGQRRVDIVQLKSFSKIYKKPIDFFLK